MRILLVVLLMVFVFSGQASGADVPISEDSHACIECHSTFNPGILAAWKKSRMSRVADYGVFANGRWVLAKNMQEMVDWLKFKVKAKQPVKE